MTEAYVLVRTWIWSIAAGNHQVVQCCLHSNRGWHILLRRPNTYLRNGIGVILVVLDAKITMVNQGSTILESTHMIERLLHIAGSVNPSYNAYTNSGFSLSVRSSHLVVSSALFETQPVY